MLLSFAAVVRFVIQSVVLVAFVSQGNCTEDIYWTISINSPNGTVANTLSAQLQDPYDYITYSISNYTSYSTNDIDRKLLPFVCNVCKLNRVVPNIKTHYADVVQNKTKRAVF